MENGRTRKHTDWLSFLQYEHFQPPGSGVYRPHHQTHHGYAERAMSVFLVRFDRRQGKGVDITEFDASHRHDAEEARFRAELEMFLGLRPGA